MVLAGARVLAALLIVSGFGPGAHASGVPLEAQAKLFLKIASYDQNLPANDLRVAVVYATNDDTSGPAALTTLRGMASVRVGGRSVSVIGAPAASVADVESATRQQSLYALFLADSTPDALVSQLRGLAKRNGWLVFAQAPRHVSLGATAAVEQDDQRRVILLNANAALEQGRQFDAGFLGVCKIVR